MRETCYFSRITVLLFIAVLSSCSAQDVGNDSSNEVDSDVLSDKEEVLFIGNSHTFYNQGLSTHLLKFRAKDNLKFEPLIQETARGRFSLNDH